MNYKSYNIMLYVLNGSFIQLLCYMVIIVINQVPKPKRFITRSNINFILFLFKYIYL